MPSDKIKSKDLSYDSNLPPFLQRLHAQKAGLGDQDKHDFAIARPKGARKNDEDDGPTVVDESGEFVSNEDYERMKKVIDADEHGEAGKRLEDGEQTNGKVVSETRKAEEKISDGLTHKKRKAAKVIGDDEDKPAEAEPSHHEVKEGNKQMKKPKTKAKKIKLAFEEDEER